MTSSMMEVGKQAQTIVNPVSGNRLPNLYTGWMSGSLGESNVKWSNSQRRLDWIE
jgi:hypothetical protein